MSFIEETVYIVDAEDLIVSVYVVKEIDFSSRYKDWSLEPATRAELKEVSAALGKQLGRYANATGRIIEDLAKDYYSSEGYRCVRATPAEDACKIDLIATRNAEVVLIQCKAGELSYKALLSYISKMMSYRKFEKDKVAICFVQKSFPKEFIFNMAALSHRFECEIMRISVSDLLKAFPEANTAIN